MNERVMQFRIGLFVIGAGLVLTMMVIWFGESPALFRDRAYVTVYYPEAPGVNVGIPVRKSGIRVGEVAEIEFTPANMPDGVLVTLALERKYQIKQGSTPRISRALIGDVSIDFQPGTGPGPMTLYPDPASSKRDTIKGEVAPDPTKALEAASAAFQKVGPTLETISDAAKGLSKLSAKVQDADQMIASFRDAGKKVDTLATDLDRVVKANEEGIGPAIASLKDAGDKISETLDPKTRASIQAATTRFADFAAKLNTVLADFEPVARDLGADATKARPTTALGQLMARANRIAADVDLLTRQLNDGNGHLNRDGTIQRMVIQSDLHDNLLQVARDARVMLRNLNIFADKVARDPSAMTRGALINR
jgi:phospholipid/cholesterol/gamma-HCH transport system substrate-binding protein